MNNGLSIMESVATLSLVVLPVAGAAQSRVSPIVVPFERAPAPYIVIRVPVAGAACAPLVFDTGTNTTVLGPALAARGGLSVGHTTTAESLNGPARAITGQVHGIGFDGLPAAAAKVAIVTDITGLRGFGRSIAGLYGHNWLIGTDYLIDYAARQIVIGPAGTLPRSTDGHRTALTWAAGRPAVTAEVRAHTVEPFSARLVLDSGADHVTLFGRAAERMALVADWHRTMLIDSGFGALEVPTATVMVNVGGRTRSVTVELRSDVEDREEDGLVPTSIFLSVLVSTAERVVVFDPHVSLPNGLRRTTCDDWPNIHVEDAYTRAAVTLALQAASRWLARPKCQTLFLEFKDERNLPLTAKLRELDTDPEGYLRMVLFLDGAQSATCKRHGVVAFTAQGSRVVYLCGRDFERAWRRDVGEVQATLIHELLHSLGVGENPPSPRAITHRIQQLCW